MISGKQCRKLGRKFLSMQSNNRGQIFSHCLNLSMLIYKYHLVPFHHMFGYNNFSASGNTPMSFTKDKISLNVIYLENRGKVFLQGVIIMDKKHTVNVHNRIIDKLTTTYKLFGGVIYGSETVAICSSFYFLTDTMGLTFFLKVAQCSLIFLSGLYLGFCTGVLCQHVVRLGKHSVLNLNTRQ